MKNRLIRTLTITVGVFFICVSVSLGRDLSNPGTMRPGEYRYIENPDKTWTEYYAGKSGEPPLQGDTYSEAEMIESDRLYAMDGIDEGTTGQTGSIVIGSDGDNMWAAETNVGDLDTGIPYKTQGEAEVGDDLIAEGIGEDALPTLGEVVATGAGAVIAGASVALVGIKIGEGISELLGWPKLDLLSSGEGTESGTFDEASDWQWNGHWLGDVKLGEVASCTLTHDAINGVENYDLIPGEQLCEFPGVQYIDEWGYTYHGERYEGHSCGFSAGKAIGFDGVYWGSTDECESGGNEDEPVPGFCPSTSWINCESRLFGSMSEGYNAIAFNIYAPLFAAQYQEFPGHRDYLNGNEITPTEHEYPPMEKIPTEVAPPPITHVPARTRTYIIETGKDKEGKKVVVPLEPGPDELPKPTNPIVPQIKPDESWTEYKTSVESEGLPSPNEHILPESLIDTSTGPEDVTTVYPSPGVTVEPDTELEVNVNPDTAPAPIEAPGGIGAPTEPGFDLPNFGILCEGFPFGVPCWLSKTIEGMAATAAAPKWTIVPELKILSHTIPAGSFDFATIEPIMEIVRPVMVAFSIIGLVLLFYKLAKGGGPEGGSGSGGGETFEENAAWHNTPEDEGGPQY